MQNEIGKMGIAVRIQRMGFTFQAITGQDTAIFREEVVDKGRGKLRLLAGGLKSMVRTRRIDISFFMAFSFFILSS